METFKLTEEYIHLNQLLKAMSWVGNGAEANSVIDAGFVKVNGETEFRKRNKIMKGFKIEFNGNVVEVQ